MFAMILSHLFAAGVGAGIVRALTLPKRQADGVAKVVNKLTPNTHLTGADVQAKNVAVAEGLVGEAAAKVTPHQEP